MTPKTELPYLEFLGLKRNPFPVTPDADDFYESNDTESIITELVHGITTRKGFFVLTGEVGVGKTTISRRILQLLTDADIKTSLVFHSLLPKLGLIKHINKDFGASSDDSEIEDELAKLNEFVLKENEQGNNCAIIIDDAQNLSWESLEIIRMISNLEGNSDKLVQILLIGQPELADKLNSKNLRQLKSRIVIQREITTLPKTGLQRYIDFKLTIAGPTRLTTTAKVIKTIYAFTRGNLRAVNILMDRCLYIAYADQSHTLTVRMIKQAANDLKMKCNVKTNQWLLLILLFIVTSGLSIYYLSHKENKPLAPQSPTVTIQTAPKPSQQTSCKLVAPRQTPPVAIISFLEGYNLQEYATPFWQSMKHRNMESISTQIQKTTGLELISLPHRPKALQNIDALEISSKADQQPRYLFFWKPQLTITEFYYNYQGSKIVQLQYLLAEKGLYIGNIDGIVGRKLMQAIINFQTQHQLNLTGAPDQPTLFVLYSLPKQKKN